MKRIITTQVNIDQVSTEEYDLCVVASGYETRARAFSEKLEINSKIKVALHFKNHEDVFSRRVNDLFFSDKHFKIILSEGDSSKPLVNYLRDFLAAFINKQDLKILIDYSSMSKVWYSAILNFFYRQKLFNGIINFTFVYSCSEYNPPPQIQAYESKVEPLEGFYSINPPHRPTALLIALGYIDRQAYGLAEYFEAEPFLFIHKHGDDDPFLGSVMTANKHLLSNISKEHIHFYNLENIKYTEAILMAICRDLSKSYRIVMAPCGPKPFTLLNLILSLRLGDVDVWRISANNNNVQLDKKPDGNFIILNLEMSPLTNDTSSNAI